jgi:hypothetical protein
MSFSFNASSYIEPRTNQHFKGTQFHLCDLDGDDDDDDDEVHVSMSFVCPPRTNYGHCVIIILVMNCWWVHQDESHSHFDACALPILEGIKDRLRSKTGVIRGWTCLAALFSMNSILLDVIPSVVPTVAERKHEVGASFSVRFFKAGKTDENFIYGNFWSRFVQWVVTLSAALVTYPQVTRYNIFQD